MKTRRITPGPWVYKAANWACLPNLAYSDWGRDLSLPKLIPPSVCSSLRKQLFILRNDVRDPLLFSLVDITWRELQALLRHVRYASQPDDSVPA